MEFEQKEEVSIIFIIEQVVISQGEKLSERFPI